MIFFQNGLKDSYDSGWKRSLQKSEATSKAGRELDFRERTGRDELKGVTDGKIFKKVRRGWW